MPEIKLPAMSPTMEEGTLAKWLVKEGDTVKPGDVLAEIETDKATMELEADEGGVVEKLHVPAGADAVKVGTLIATIRGEGDAEAPVSTAAPVAAAPTASAAQPSEAPAPNRPEVIVKPKAGETPASLDVKPEGGGPTHRQTVREALRDAMAEEMRADGSVFIMGEEVAEIGRAHV